MMPLILWSTLRVATPVPQLEPGWPVAVRASGTVCVFPLPNGIAGLVSSDGTFISAVLHRFLPDGTEPEPWPKVWPTRGITYIPRTYPIGDLDWDGHLEIFLPGSYAWKTVDLITGETRRVKEFQVVYFWSTPSFYDADGDGTPEVYWMEANSSFGTVKLFKYNPVFHSIDSLVMVRSNPSYVWGFGIYTQAFGDFDGDREPEMAVFTPERYSPVKGGNTKVFTVDVASWSIEKEVWLHGVPFWGPRAADVDGDGVPEIVVGTATLDKVPSIQTSSYYIVDFQTSRARLLRRFDENGIGGLWPAFADANGDGLPEVIVAYRSPFPPYPMSFYAFDAQGEEVAYCEIPEKGSVLYAYADVDGDGADDIVHARTSYEGRPGFVAYDFQGQLLWSVTLPPYDTSERYNSAFLFLWDVDGDEKPEMMGAKALPDSQEVYGYKFLSLFEIPLENPHLGWPMLYHDPWNTNNYDFWPPQVGVGESSGKTQGSLTLKPTLKGLLVRSPKPQKLPLRVYDPAGRLLYKAELTLKPGENLVEIPGKGVRLVMVGKAKAKVVGR